MTQDTKREALIAGLALVRRHHERTRDNIDGPAFDRKTARGCIRFIDDAIAALSTHPTPTAEQGGEIGKQHRDLWQSSILTMYSTEPQRRAFVDGYNGREKPRRASAGMAKAWSLGAEVSRLLNPDRWPDLATLTKSNGDPA